MGGTGKNTCSPAASGVPAIALTACVEGSTVECESQCLCPMRGRWDPVNVAIQHALLTITLADMQEASIPRGFRIPAAARLPAAEGTI